MSKSEVVCLWPLISTSYFISTSCRRVAEKRFDVIQRDKDEKAQSRCVVKLYIRLFDYDRIYLSCVHCREMMARRARSMREGLSNVPKPAANSLQDSENEDK
jgi:hypothetical protein